MVALSVLPLLVAMSTLTSFCRSETTQFDLASLTLSSLKLLGDSHFKNGTIGLSRELSVPNSSAGRALYVKPVRLMDESGQIPASFSTFFTFSVTNVNPASIGAGLTFLLVPDDQTIGDSGPYLGLLNVTAPSSSVVAIEFDTLMDVQFMDINGNHVGLDLNSMASFKVSDLGDINLDLKSGNLINAWIDYNGESRVMTISVSYSNQRPLTPLMYVEVDLAPYLHEFMYVGFSASTQGSTEVHTIAWWTFSASTSPSPSPPQQMQQQQQPPSSAPVPSGLVTVGTTPSPPSPRTSSSCHNQLCNRKPAAVAGVVTAGAFFLAFVTGLLIWGVRLRKRPPKLLQDEGSNDSDMDIVVEAPKKFSYAELRAATNAFDPTRVIGHGAFGTVYRGVLPSIGVAVAVKRCSHEGSQGKAEFLSELSIVGSLRHRNLVRLQGWCSEGGEILLVYDYMPNGSLDKALFNPHHYHLNSSASLPWAHRRKILVGVASALSYLHEECENQVIHRDVKASNIMLDEGFNAKLGDFGLARQTQHDKTPNPTVTAGTMGYLAPEYLLSGCATDKSDVFSYGAVVLEVACGRRPIDKEGGIGNLVEWVWGLHGQGRIVEAADPKLRVEFEEEEMRRVLMVGLACSHPDPIGRPAMRSVVQILNGEAPLPPLPTTRPTMSFTNELLMNLQDSVSDCDFNGRINHSDESSSVGSFSSMIPPPPLPT
ncbi:hypothetical protein AMTRI_Chr08g205840 [Amborella trichopoda]|uniref:non-specific serine/threonine protein kinase n=1 Tax=Amborella trichopoda TaxID=13333 RepID=W1NQV2_AMBTC|nr:L-type lectin-domain containing receptor kinase VIII.2 [Amborella trichopoda]ERM99326.1 hypothetical protein AMTR_s00108p00087870 [Amborella trichopoda]|eukprot:XP_006836473.1 L-type lectin-domain containing receptor kinase VIII.2 [Amborella trichopoda]